MHILYWEIGFFEDDTRPVELFEHKHIKVGTFINEAGRNTLRKVIATLDNSKKVGDFKSVVFKVTPFKTLFYGGGAIASDEDMTDQAGTKGFIHTAIVHDLYLI